MKVRPVEEIYVRGITNNKFGITWSGEADEANNNVYKFRIPFEMSYSCKYLETAMGRSVLDGQMTNFIDVL